jgi:hypothetical protein
MAALGWKEGAGYTLVERWADARLDRLPTLAAQIAARKPRVIVAAPTAAVKASLTAGLAAATAAYGKVVAADAKRAATKMLERAEWRRRCAAALSLTDTRTLLAGLRQIAAGL